MSASQDGAASAQRRPKSLWGGIALSVIGLVGLVLLANFQRPEEPQCILRFLRPRPCADIRVSGRTHLPQQHGRDGRGGTVRAMMGGFETPDIRWSALILTQGAHAAVAADRR